MKVGALLVKRTVIIISIKYKAYERRLLTAAPFIPSVGMRVLLSKIEDAVRINENNNEKA